MKYDITKKVEYGFEEAMEKTKRVLAEFGFGVLTEIDMAAKFKSALRKDSEEYTILGACHPASAYEAIQAEVEVGLLLPCNVIVYRKNDETFVSAINPKVAINISENKVLEKISNDIYEKLRAVINKI